MRVCVAGLGIIGGSICMALKRNGNHAVYGWNRSSEPLSFALANGIIDGAAADFRDYDVVIVAMPPEATLDFINSNVFSDGAVVADICGVKKWIEDGVFCRQRNFRYVGCHPMAGKEVSTIHNACADLFDRASMVITHCPSTDPSAVEIMRGLTRDIGFACIVECTADEHDRKIAYTSQLAHVLSNAYVKDSELDGCIGFTGGSFQDMTRIAGVDENVWASLYLKNAGNLSEKISSLMESLGEIRSALDGGDVLKLSSVLREGRLLFESRRESSHGENIRVTKLK